MKLLGKFSEIIGFQSTLRDNFEKSKAIHKIADDYAIEFAEWLFLWQQNSIGEWKHQNKNKIIKSTKELLEIFKQEKGYGGV